MTPFQVFCFFLAIKQHFTRPSYDVIKYNWKVKASLDSFHKRNDRYFYERLSRKKNEQEVKDFFISNFVYSSNPQRVYISDLMKDGEEVYINWMKRNQSLSYIFKNEISDLLHQYNLNELIKCKNSQHSILIRKHLQNTLSIESLVIFEKILHYVRDYDKVLDDPIWDSLKLKIKKYERLLNIDMTKYSKIIQELVCE